MLRPIITTIAAFGLATSAAAADRAPSPSAKSERLAGNIDRALTWVLIAALVGAIVIATIDNGNSNSGDNPASP